MNHQQPPRQTEQPEQSKARSSYDRHHDPWHEHDPHHLHPRIWIASLADYNNGRLHGKWIKADQDPDDLERAAKTILANTSEPDAEEWAIHDYDDFPGVRIGEHESLEDVAAIAKGLAKHGPAFGAWTNLCRNTTGTLDHDLLTQFEDHYLGSYMTTQQWAQEEAEALGLEDTLDHTLPSALRWYVTIDYVALARDLELNGDITVAPNPEGGAWVFRVT